jgi:hypothetical protein
MLVRQGEMTQRLVHGYAKSIFRRADLAAASGCTFAKLKQFFEPVACLGRQLLPETTQRKSRLKSSSAQALCFQLPPIL